MKGFARVPHDLLLDQRLTGNARGCYGLFLTLAWQRGRRSEEDVIVLPTLDEIAVVYRCSVPSLRTYIKELVEVGWIAAIRGGGRPTRYRIFDAPQGKENSTSNGKKSAHSRAGASKELEAKKKLEAQSPLGSSLAKPRPRDIVFDAMAEATASDPHLEGKVVGKAISQLRGHPDYADLLVKQGKEIADMALAKEIPVRAAAYRRYFSADVALTPLALVKHWRRVGEQRRAVDDDLFGLRT